jgi:hypothetical protein
VAIRLTVLALLALVGCGGNVFVDGGGGSSGRPSASSGGPTTCDDVSGFALGGACSTEGQSCPIAHACCSAEAACIGHAWVVNSPSCTDRCIQCGPTGLACEATAVCVVEEELAEAYSCAARPACGVDLTCGCAGSVCSASSQCVQIKNDTTVVCDCPAC